MANTPAGFYQVCQIPIPHLCSSVHEQALSCMSCLDFIRSTIRTLHRKVRQRRCWQHSRKCPALRSPPPYTNGPSLSLLDFVASIARRSSRSSPPRAPPSCNAHRVLSPPLRFSTCGFMSPVLRFLHLLPHPLQERSYGGSLKSL